MNNNVKALKSGIWYIFSTILVNGIGFFMTPIYSRILSKTEFGLFSDYTSVLAIATIIVTLKLDATLIAARYDFSGDFDSYIFSMVCLSVFFVIFWIVVCNVFSSFFVSILGIDSYYINVMLIYLATLPAVNLYLARERYFFEYKKSVQLSIILSLATALVSVFLVVIMEDKLRGRILGYSIPTIIIGTAIIIWLVHKGMKISYVYWKYALPVCIPFIPHSLSLIVLSSVDKIMVTRVCSPEENALYSLAFTCAMVITMLLSALNSAYGPWLGEKLHLKEYSLIKKVSKVYMLGFMGLSIGFILVAPEVIALLGGKAYSDGIAVFPPVAAGCILQFFYCLFVNVEQYEKKTVWMAVASASAAGLNFLLNSVLLPKYGYISAAYTTYIGYLWLLLAHMLIVYKYGYKDIYSYKLVALMIAVCTAIMPMATLLYNHSVLRYCLIGVYIIFFCLVINKYKKNILRLFNSNYV